MPLLSEFGNSMSRLTSRNIYFKKSRLSRSTRSMATTSSLSWVLFLQQIQSVILVPLSDSLEVEAKMSYERLAPRLLMWSLKVRKKVSLT